MNATQFGVSKARADSRAQSSRRRKGPLNFNVGLISIATRNHVGDGKELEPEGRLWITSQKRVCCYRIWYNTSLNAALLVQKCKPETRGFCGLPKPRFRLWQNVRVSPGPGFFKTRVSIPNIIPQDQDSNPIPNTNRNPKFLTTKNENHPLRRDTRKWTENYSTRTKNRSSTTIVWVLMHTSWNSTSFLWIHVELASNVYILQTA